MDPLRLIPDDGGEVIIITTNLVLVGRDPICDIQLSDASVSRQHAEIRFEDDGWLVRDLNSANGVRVDGKQTPRGLLLHGQRLQFGSVGFRVETDQGGGYEGATVALPRPGAKATARDHQESDNRPTMTGSTRAAKEGAPKSHQGLAVALAGLALLAIGVGFWLRGQATSRASSPTSGGTVPAVALTDSPAASTAVTPVPSPTATATPAATAIPTPVAAAPSPSPTPTPTTTPAATATPVVAAAVTATLPRGVIMISTDARATVLVNGQLEGVLPAGGFRRVEVAPGEHIVTFEVGKQRRDIVVRTKANEQAVARFEIRSLRTAAPAAPPRRQATDSPRTQATPPPSTPRTAVVAPTQAPAPAVAAPAPPAPARSTTPPRIDDAGLAKGAAATTRADFYRALLILNDAVRRLDQDPQSGADLVIAHAYLAWTYHGLGRAADAQNSAQRAMRLDPGVLAKLGSFPAPVLDLFKASR